MEKFLKEKEAKEMFSNVVKCMVKKIMNSHPIKVGFNQIFYPFTFPLETYNSLSNSNFSLGRRPYKWNLCLVGTTLCIYKWTFAWTIFLDSHSASNSVF